MSISNLIEPEPTPLESEQQDPVGTVQNIMDEAPVIEAPVVEAPVVQDELLNAILNKIAPVQATKKNLKVLIYSDPGAGKSTFLGTAPNNLIIDVEDGLMSLNNHPELMAENVQTIRYSHFAGLERIISKLAENPAELASFETLSVDSMSELHKRGLQEVTEREWQRNPISSNRYVAETEHYTETNEHIRRLASSLRDLDRNLILTAHARTVEPKGKPAKTYPDFSEKLANTIAGIVDVVGYMYKKEVDGEVIRVLRLHSEGTIQAKTRLGGFPDEIINPTWDSLWSVLQSNS